jgi:hypothetical protein
MSYKDERNKAAEKYSSGCNAEFELPEVEADFKSGADWALTSEVVRGLMSAVKDINDTWDASNPASVVPRLHEGDFNRNDSLAAGAIHNCIRAFEACEKAMKEIEK